MRALPAGARSDNCEHDAPYLKCGTIYANDRLLKICLEDSVSLDR